MCMSWPLVKQCSSARMTMMMMMMMIIHGEESEDNEEEAKDKEPVLIQKIKCEPCASTSKSTPKEKKTQSKTPPAKIRHQDPPRQKLDTKPPQAKIRHQDPPRAKSQTPRPPRQKSDTKTPQGPKADTTDPPRPKSKGFKAKGSGQEGGSRGPFRTYRDIKMQKGLTTMPAHMVVLRI